MKLQSLDPWSVEQASLTSAVLEARSWNNFLH